MEKPLEKKSAQILGAWKLISFEIRRENGEVVYPFGKNAKGIIIYTDSGRMSVQLTRPDRPQFSSGDQLRGTDKEIRANYEGFVSYYGPYEFYGDKGFVVHHLEGSLFPNWEGQRHKRFFEFSGNRLKLSTPPTLWGGGEIVAIKIWERIDCTAPTYLQPITNTRFHQICQIASVNVDS